jgi:hypothetical protein
VHWLLPVPSMWPGRPGLVHGPGRSISSPIYLMDMRCSTVTCGAHFTSVHITEPVWASSLPGSDSGQASEPCCITRLRTSSPSLIWSFPIQCPCDGECTEFQARVAIMRADRCRPAQPMGRALVLAKGSAVQRQAMAWAIAW